jgi:uncharacterized protein YeaO (DUF488 family)
VAVRSRRVYDDVEPADGQRVLVERLWPRGIKKDDPRVGIWLKDVAPSHELRKSFHADGDYERFVAAYRDELSENRDAFDELRRIVGDNRTVTLVYSAKDTEHNSATVLMDLLKHSHPKS